MGNAEIRLHGRAAVKPRLRSWLASPAISRRCAMRGGLSKPLPGLSLRCIRATMQLRRNADGRHLSVKPVLLFRQSPPSRFHSLVAAVGRLVAPVLRGVPAILRGLGESF